MNTKHHLTTILIFAAIFLSCFSSNAQNSSGLIRAEKRGLGYIYYKDNVMLNFRQVMQATSSNPEALKLMKESNNMRNVGYVFAFLGGGCVGYSLGYALGRTISNNEINYGIFGAVLGVGAALIGVGISFEVGANKKAKEGVDVFNNAIRQKNNANLDLGFSPGGVMLRLNF